MPALEYWGRTLRRNLDHIDPGNAGGSVVIPDSPAVEASDTAPTFTCSACGATFSNLDHLFDHRFSEHPIHRPILVLEGNEVLTPRQIIRSKLSIRGIALENASQCWIDNESISLKKFPARLSTARNGFMVVRLKSADGPLEETYELKFQIPSTSDLHLVEKRFLEVSRNGELHVDSIQRFISQTRKAESALELVDALSHYLYGVLSKDQRGGTHLSQDEGRARFNRALQGLIGYESELGKVLIELINFSQNAFNDGAAASASPSLAFAMRRFDAMTQGIVGVEPERVMPVSELSERTIPLDAATDQIVRWATLPVTALGERLPEMSAALGGEMWSQEDRFKVRVLLAMAASHAGKHEIAISHARLIQNEPSFSEWATRILEKSKGV